MPPAVPFETDASGNPLADLYTNANDPTKLRIPCTHAARRPACRRRHRLTGAAIDGCPAHLPVVERRQVRRVRRRRLVGPLVLQQPDLHRGRGLDRRSRASSKPDGRRNFDRAPRSDARRLSLSDPPSDSHDRPSLRRIRSVLAAAAASAHAAGPAGCASRCCTSSLLGGLLFARRPRRSSAAPTTRTHRRRRRCRPRGDADSSRRRAAATRTPRSCARCAGSGSTTRCCIARAWRCRSTRATRRSASA